MNRPWNVFLTVIFVLVTPLFSLANDIYIAQNAIGANNGADCNDAYAASWFNNSSNWGSGSGKIGPGTTVHMCSGTFTYNPGTTCGLSFNGSGSSGSPITLIADQGPVTVTAPYWTTGSGTNGAPICSSGYNYVNINGDNQLTLEASANGSSLANQVDYGFGVWALTGNNVTIENLTISNIYVHTQCVAPYTGCDEGGQNTGGIAAEGSNVTITGNTVHDAKWCITGGVPGSATIANRVISNNTEYHCDHAVAVGVGDVNGILNGLQVSGNNMYDFNAWDDNPSVNYNHHDGIHIWSYDSGDSITGALIYDNYIHGDWGASWNSAMFTEASTGVPSAYYFNNILVDQSSEAHQGCGIFCQEENGVSIFNNTIVSSGASGGGSFAINIYGTGAVIENNTTVGAVGAIQLESGATLAAMDYNNYYNLGPSGWNFTSSFSTWKSSCSCDSHSSNTNPNLNVSYQPTSASAAIIEQGQNLNTLGVAALDSDYVGTERPGSGTCSTMGSSTCWGVGAYQYGSSNPAPTPPTGLSAVIE